MSRQFSHRNAVEKVLEALLESSLTTSTADQLVIEGDQVSQAGSAFHKPTLAGSDPLVVVFTSYTFNI